MFGQFPVFIGDGRLDIQLQKSSKRGEDQSVRMKVSKTMSSDGENGHRMNGGGKRWNFLFG